MNVISIIFNRIFVALAVGVFLGWLGVKMLRHLIG